MPLMHAIENLKTPCLIAYNLFKGPAAAVLTEVSAKGLRVMIKSRKEFPIKKADLFSAGAQVLGGPEDYVQALQKLEDKVESMQADLDLPLLHSMMLEEGEEGLEFPQMVELWFGAEAGLAESLALARALGQEPCLFKRKKERFLPNSQEYIDAYWEQMRRLEEKQKQLETRVQLLVEDGRLDSEALEANARDFEELAALAGHWRSEVLARWQDVFQQAGIRDMLDLRRILIQRGIVSEDHLFELLECGWPEQYSQAYLEALETLEFPPELKQGRDLTHLKSFTIDSASTRDRDDALSYEASTATFYIHIAHVASFVQGHQKVEKELEKRLTSLYLPEGGFSMFPPGVAHKKLSLDEGREVWTMTVAVRFTENGPQTEVYPARIRVDQNFSYEEIDQKSRDMQIFFEASEQIKNWRSGHGAVTFRGRECDVRPGPVIQLVPREQIPSMDMIAEFAILANWAFASFCQENGIPILFRTQSGDREQVLNHPHYQPQIEDFYQYWQVKKTFGRTSFDTEKTGHLSLGLSHYTQMTSPIRRYMDYLNQTQLHRFFEDETLKSREEMEEISMMLSSPLHEMNSVQDKRRKHWLLKWMMQEGEKQGGHGLELVGLAVEVFDQDVLVRLDDLGTIFKFKRGYAELKPGQMVKIRVSGARLLEREPIAEIQPMDVA